MKRSLIIVTLIALVAALMVLGIRGRRMPIVPEKPEPGMIEEIFRRWDQVYPLEVLSRSDTRTLLSTVQYLMMYQKKEEISIGSDAFQAREGGWKKEGGHRRRLATATYDDYGLQATINFMCYTLIDCNDLGQKTVTGLITQYISTVDLNGDGIVDDKPYSYQDVEQLCQVLLSDTVSDLTKAGKTFKYLTSQFNGQTGDEINGEIIKNWDSAWTQYQQYASGQMKDVENTKKIWTMFVDAIRRIEREKPTEGSAPRRRLFVLQIIALILWFVALILLVVWVLTAGQFPILLKWSGSCACVGVCAFFHIQNCNHC